MLRSSVKSQDEAQVALHQRYATHHVTQHGDPIRKILDRHLGGFVVAARRDGADCRTVQTARCSLGRLQLLEPATFAGAAFDRCRFEVRLDARRIISTA